MKLRRSTVKKVAKKAKAVFNFILNGLSSLIPAVGAAVTIMAAAWKAAKLAYANSKRIRDAVDDLTETVDHLVFEQGNPESEAEELRLMGMEDYDATANTPMTVDAGTQTPILGDAVSNEPPAHPQKMASVIFNNVEKLMVRSLANGDIQFTMTPTPVAAAA